MSVPSSKRALAKALKTYIKHPRKSTLRVYLRRKGKRGHFDHRMLDWYDVPDNINDACKAFIRRGYVLGLVPTATTNGRHATSSYHYPSGGVGRAVDMGLIEAEIGTRKGMDRMERFQRQEYEAWQEGRRDHMMELIGPINNNVVLRDKRSPLAEGSDLEEMHDNHVHGAFTS